MNPQPSLCNACHVLIQAARDPATIEDPISAYPLETAVIACFNGHNLNQDTFTAYQQAGRSCPDCMTDLRPDPIPNQRLRRIATIFATLENNARFRKFSSTVTAIAGLLTGGVAFLVIPPKVIIQAYNPGWLAGLVYSATPAVTDRSGQVTATACTTLAAVGTGLAAFSLVKWSWNRLRN